MNKLIQFIRTGRSPQRLSKYKAKKLEKRGILSASGKDYDYQETLLHRGIFVNFCDPKRVKNICAQDRPISKLICKGCGTSYIVCEMCDISKHETFCNLECFTCHEVAPKID